MIIPQEIQNKILMRLPLSDLLRLKKEDFKLNPKVRIISQYVYINTRYHNLRKAITCGTLMNIQWIYNIRGGIFQIYVLDIIERGNLDIIKYVDDKVRWPIHICINIYELTIGPHCVDIIKWFMEKGFKLYNESMPAAVRNKNKNMIELLINNGCSWNVTFKWLILSCDIDMLSHFREIYYKKYKTYLLCLHLDDFEDWCVMIRTMMFNRTTTTIDIMNWVNEFVFVFTILHFKEVFRALCSSNHDIFHYDLLDWFIYNELKPNNEFIDIAEECAIIKRIRYKDNMDPFIWLKMNNCYTYDISILDSRIFGGIPYLKHIISKYTADQNVFNMEAKHGNLHNLRYLYLNDRTYDDDTIFAVIDRSVVSDNIRSEIIDWLCFVKYRLTKAAYDYAIKKGDQEIIDCLLKWNCPSL